MLNKKQSLLRIIGATSICIFTLFAGMLGAYAWFTSIRLNRGNADGFVLVKTNYVKALNIYAQKDYDTTSTSAYLFDGDNPLITYSLNSEGNFTKTTKISSPTTAVTGVDDFVPLGTYDYLFNKPRCLLYQFTVDCNYITSDQRDHLYFSCATDTTLEDSLIKLNVTTTDGISTISPKNALQVAKSGQTIPDANKMSSVIQFSQFVRKDTNDQFDYTEDMKTDTPSSFAAVPDTDDITNISYSYNSTLRFSIPVSSLPSTGQAYISFILQYNPEVMEFVLGINESLDNPDLDDAGSYYFKQDWKFIVK